VIDDSIHHLSYAFPSIHIRHLVSHASQTAKEEHPHFPMLIPYCAKPIDSIRKNLLLYERGFSFFSFHSADRPTPETFTTLKRTPGISPFAFPLRPKPARRTSSFSSTKLRQPSLGTKILNQPFVHSHPFICSFVPLPSSSRSFLAFF
jgi:hypothetical protein